MSSIQTRLMEDPRENAGSISSNRFDFQKDWAICKLLELHEQRTDYALILDLHDDVVVLDSSKTPLKADFYQVKTKEDKKWKLNELIRRHKGISGHLSSKLGKLYQHKIKFKDHTQSLNFVSNASYDVELSDENKSAKRDRISASDLKDKDKLIDFLSIELEVDKKDIDENIIFLEFTDLSIHSHSDATKGKISEFIEKRTKHQGYQLGLIYRTLFDEIRTKTNKERYCESFEDLIKFKSVSQKSFDEILDIVLSSFDKDVWPYVHQDLLFEKYSLSERQSIRDSWLKYTIDRMDKTNLVLTEIIKEISIIIKGIKPETCRELIENVIENINKSKIDKQKIFQDDYLKAIILMEYFSNEN